MKVVAYCILHYGMEWLHWSISSVLGFVDEVHIFYTPSPSHGHGTNIPCPETGKMLRASVDSLMNQFGNVYWHDTNGFRHEGLQRHHAVDTCIERGADIILVVDADELWDPIVLENTLDFVEHDDSPASSYRIGMRHFWRSMNWVCDDAAMPTRILRPRDFELVAYLGSDIGKVFHMGYAQSPRIIEYKQGIHGHKGEWRQGWFENKFLPWTPADPFGDVHPTNKDYWFPKPIAVEVPPCNAESLKALCYDHPYLHTELITNESW